MVKKPKAKKILWLGLVFAILVVACGLYLGDYYRADPEAIAAFAPAQEITEAALDDGTLVFAPERAETGLIFYPGGKVEHTAYIPLMRACASEGILCILVKMPFRLAVLDVNAAEGIQEQYPEIEHWYMAGQSLGGSMAASYLERHPEDFAGLILLGSYSTANLSETNLEVLSVYGSEDQVLNRDKYAENRANLPDNTTEIIIEGGCHAYFGMYGHQSGDGVPAVTNKEQIDFTVEEIAKLVS